MTENNAAQAADQDPLSDEYVNAVIQQHGYLSPEAVTARLWQWIVLHGGENGVTLLIYEAHKALVKLRAPVADMYVEARECSACGHVGINDSSDTLAACKNCDWSGASPKEDHCPGCAQHGTMTAACPKCGSQYSLLADRTITAALASAPVAGEAQISDDDVLDILAEFGEHHIEHGRIVFDKWTLRAAGEDLMQRCRNAGSPANNQGWSGWACQYPDKLPRLYGAREIAELNCDPDNGDRMLFLSESTAPQPRKPDFSDAYEGAREDLAIWKRRALAAERDLRAERETSSRLVAAINAENGPTYMGDAVPQASEAAHKEAAAIARSFGAPDMADALEGRASEAVRDVEAIDISAGRVEEISDCRQDVVLPPLPEALALQPGQLGHTDQTLDYFARAAVLADRQHRAALSAQPGAQKNCNCATCRPHSVEMRMILCSICGDKRCPHAADHRNACAGTAAQKDEPLPTETMVVVGFEAVSGFQGTDAYKAMTGCQQAAESAKVCWAAMLEAMPEGSQPRQDVAPTDEALLGLWAEALWPCGDVCESKETVLRFARETLARFGAAQKQGGSDA